MMQLERWSLKEANFKIFTGSADAKWSSGFVVHCIYTFSMAINITHWRSTIPQKYTTKPTYREEEIQVIYMYTVANIIEYEKNAKWNKWI